MSYGVERHFQQYYSYIVAVNSRLIIALMKIKSSRSMVDNRINLSNMNQESVPCHTLFMYYFHLWKKSLKIKRGNQKP